MSIQDSTARLLSQPFKIAAKTDIVLEPGRGDSARKLKEFDEMRESGDLCDVLFLVKGLVSQVKKKIWGHKVIVSHASSHCASIISSSKKVPVEIEVDCIEQEVLDKIVSYMYVGHLTIPLSKVELFYAASHILQLGKVKEECIKLLTTNALAYPASTLKRAPEPLDASSVFGDLWFQVFNRVFEGFVIFIDSDEFAEIPEKQFKTVIQLFLTHKPELDHKMLCFATNTWVKHNRTERVGVVNWLLKVLHKDSKFSKFLIREITDTLKEGALVGYDLDSSSEQMDVEDEASDATIKVIHSIRTSSRKRPSETATPSDAKKPNGVELNNENVMIFIEGDGSGKRSLWMFEFKIMKFTFLMAMPTLSDMQITQEEIVYADHKIYAIGGLKAQEGQTSDCVFSADLRTRGTWSQNNKLNIARKEFAALVYDDCIYVIGGTNTKNSRGSLSSVERYNFKSQGSKWVFVANMTEPRVSCCAAVVRNHIFVVGGKQNKGSKVVLNSVEVFDVANNMWTEIVSMWIPRCEFGLVTCANQLYALGGEGDEGVLDSGEVYDPETNKWSFITNLTEKRKYPGAVALDGKIYMFGGYNHNSVRITSSELYHPKSCAWEGYVKPGGVTSSFRTVALAPKSEITKAT